MKALAALSALAVCVTTVPANAATFVKNITLTNVASVDDEGSALNTLMSVFLAANAQVTGVGYSGTLDALDPSWRSEIAVKFLDSPNGLRFRPGIADETSGSASYNTEIIDLVGLSFDFALGADGLLNLEFFETFNDYDQATDGIWNGTLTVQYEAVGGAVPEPANWALMIGGFGLVGGTMRNRRKVSVTYA